MNEQKEQSLHLNRLKYATEEYRVHKSIYLDPVTEEPLPGFQDWPTFRDAFIADWCSNRRVVTTEEADVHFDRLADESLSELAAGGVTDVNQVVDQLATAGDVEAAEAVTETAAPASDSATAPAVATAPKRRGRPPKVRVVVDNTAAEPAAPATTAKRKSYYVPVSQRKAAKATKPTRKVAAKKKSGNTAAKAQTIVERYVARGWARKDIIEKLTSQIDGLGAAYAATLYQKFA